MNYPRYISVSHSIIKAATAKNSTVGKVRLTASRCIQRTGRNQQLRHAQTDSVYPTQCSMNAAYKQRCFSVLSTTNSLLSSTSSSSEPSTPLVTNTSMVHHFSTNDSSSPKKQKKKKKKMIPRKAAIALTPKARTLFQNLLSNVSNPDVVGIMLEYRQSSDAPRMVFAFDFVKKDQLTDDDEGVSLEVVEDGVTPKPPSESLNDGLPKLYIHHNAFMKVLGCTVDVEIDDSGMFTPILFDREGNIMDPNA